MSGGGGTRGGLGLSARTGLAAGLAVALAILLTSTAVYAATDRLLYDGLDRELVDIMQDVVEETRRGAGGMPSSGPRRDPLGGRAGVVASLDVDGERAGGVDLPVTARAAALARGTIDVPALDRRTLAGTEVRSVQFETVVYEGAEPALPLRVLTVPVQAAGEPVGAVQVAVPADQEEVTLARLRRILLVGGLVGILGAAVVGWWLGRRATRPVVALTDVANEVRATGDLGRRIDVDTDDEIGRLAATFNSMLAALERIQQSQTQLVADASHELRTPLTSLRTNIEVLDDFERLDPTDRADLLADVRIQLDEFGHLVDSLVALTRDARADTPLLPVDLAEVVTDVVAALRAFVPPGRTLQVDLDRAATVLADRDSLERAVRNLVDNAIKHGEGAIEVAVVPATAVPGAVPTAQGGPARVAVTVRDHGPGVAPDQRERIFDRFHRAPGARGTPGSGLGLSIVAQSAARHGGQAGVVPAPGGGAMFVLTLPTIPPPPART